MRVVAPLPEAAVQYLRAEPEVERVVAVETDLGDISANLAQTEAMIARGYTGGAGRSHYVRLRPTMADLIAIGVVAVLVGGLLAGPWKLIDARALAWLAGLK